MTGVFPMVQQEERAALEEKVTQQLAAERRALLARKRAQQDERRRKADDLERILHENQRKVPPQHCICMGYCAIVPVPAAACAGCCAPCGACCMPVSAILLLYAAKHDISRSRL